MQVKVVKEKNKHAKISLLKRANPSENGVIPTLFHEEIVRNNTTLFLLKKNMRMRMIKNTIKAKKKAECSPNVAQTTHGFSIVP